jgi:transposase
MRHEQGLEHRQRAGRPGPAEPVYAGIDTHADTHHVAVIDAHGRAVDDVRVEATARGYRQVVRFLARWADVVPVGVECTGSYGAGLTRALTEAGYDVREVNRPNRFDRRARGKTDVFDAYSAAEAVLSGRATAVPKGGDGLVEALRALRTTRSSALRNGPRSTRSRPCWSPAPESTRARYRGLSNNKLTAALAASRPPAQPVTAEEATAYCLRTLARRYRMLSEQVTDRKAQLTRLLDGHAPALMAVYGTGPDTVSQLLITAGDNPARLRSEAHFAALAGARPIPASSGKTNRHRLNRAGDRQANSALYHIVIVRMAHHQPTRDYVARRTAQGRTKMEIIRCLKRYLARHLYRLVHDTLAGQHPALTA